MTTYLPGWKKYREIVIDHTKIDSDLTDYPLLLLLSTAAGITDADLTSIFTELGANGLKIAVADDSGNEFYVEEVSWDQATPLSELWTKAVAVSSASDSKVVFYYDSTHADNSTYVGVVGSTPGKAVWDSDFVAVYHMNDVTTSTIADSTGVNNGTKKGVNEPIQAAGGIGQAQDFDGSDDSVNMPQSTLPKANDAKTLELIVNGEGTGADYFGAMATRVNHGGVDNELKGYLFTISIAAGTTGRLLYNHTGKGDTISLPVLNLGTDYYAAITTGANGASVVHYLDGTSRALTTNTIIAANAETANGYTTIGRQSIVYSEGKISETRISNIVRSAAYIKANQYGWTDDLITFGAEQIAGGPMGSLANSLIAVGAI
jgi:hypothetical protein